LDGFSQPRSEKNARLQAVNMSGWKNLPRLDPPKYPQRAKIAKCMFQGHAILTHCGHDNVAVILEIVMRLFQGTTILTHSSLENLKVLLEIPIRKL
jgi:hypothetical protein